MKRAGRTNDTEQRKKRRRGVNEAKIRKKLAKLKMHQKNRGEKESLVN
jgi:hypothetical protein